MGPLKKLRPVLVPAIVLTGGATLLAWLLLAEPPPPPAPQEAAPAGTGREAPVSPPVRNSVKPQTNAKGETTRSLPPLPSEIRDVSPEGITPPEVTGMLTRIEPSQRYLDLINPPVEPVPDGEFELRRPQVIDAGTLGIDGLVVRIAHVNALKTDDTCVSRVGGTWPCGARARTALRGLVRMFTVVCQKTGDLGPRQIAATCTRRTTDIGEWLIRYGWADPGGTAPDHYLDLAEEAKQRKLGKWQSEWLKELPAPAASLSVPDPSSGPNGGESNILFTPPEEPLGGQIR